MGRLSARCGGVWDGEGAGLGEGAVEEDPNRVDQKTKPGEVWSTLLLTPKKARKCRESLLELYDVRRWRHRWKVVRVKENFDGHLSLPRYHAISHTKNEIASLEEAEMVKRETIFR